MELRAYWRIVYGRLWLIVGLVVIVLVGSVTLRARPAPVYTASLRFIVGVPPEAVRGEYYTYDRYYNWLASEYLADDYSEVVKSAAFAADVTARLNGELNVPGGVIQGSTVAEKQHRILTMRITWGDEEQLRLIANAAARTLQEESAKYFAQLGASRAEIYLIDPPVVVPVGPSLTQKLDLPLRLFLALLAGVALAFLLDYLDDTVRDRAEVEALGLEVLAEIPPATRSWLPWSHPQQP